VVLTARSLLSELLTSSFKALYLFRDSIAIEIYLSSVLYHHTQFFAAYFKMATKPDTTTKETMKNRNGESINKACLRALRITSANSLTKSS
jgi:hypothetical protein